MRLSLRVALLVASFGTAVLAGCGGGERRTDGAADGKPDAVDSALPIPELLARFRAELGDSLKVDTFANAAPNRDALVRRFVEALNARDTLAFRRLMLSRAEFAWLYYDDHFLSKPPYEMPPFLMWSMAVASSEDGLGTALREYGGRGFTLVRTMCPDSARPMGGMTIHERCVIRMVGAAKDTVENRFFGTIVERNGRWKFASFSSDL